MNLILSNIRRILSNLSKKQPIFKKIKPAYILGTFLFLIGIYSMIIYNLNLKEKRTQEITSFLSNDQTILLKNYILNQIKSPYLEYEYIVKDNDTIESILKKFSVKRDEIALIVKQIKKRIYLI